MTPRQQIATLAVILVVVAVVDFAQRIHVPRSAASRETGIETATLADQPLTLASARQRLQSWFPGQEAGSQVAPTDEATGGRDSGVHIPDRADIGEWRFVLRGVFDAGPPFAVFDVSSSAGGAIEQHRLEAGEEVKGVRVERIAGRSVSLSDGDNKIHLALFIDPGVGGVPGNEQDGKPSAENQ